LGIKNITSLGRWIDWVFDKFDHADLYYGHGTDNAWDEAVQLVLQVMRLPMDSGQEVVDIQPTEQQIQRITELTQQRIETRKPLPYLLKTAWFSGQPYYVDERVLIPRSPFAEWIERQFVPWVDPEQMTRILEIGTGSGCMAIGLAEAFPHAVVDAVDVSGDALAVASINVKQYELVDRINLIHSDCYQALDKQQRYDLIVSNPPYVSDEEIAGLPMEYRHEPVSAALRAGDEGLDMVMRIIADANLYLKPAGILVVEVGCNDQLLQSRFPTVPFLWLEQERGGQGLFLLTDEELQQHGHVFESEVNDVR